MPFYEIARKEGLAWSTQGRLLYAESLWAASTKARHAEHGKRQETRASRFRISDELSDYDKQRVLSAAGVNVSTTSVASLWEIFWHRTSGKYSDEDIASAVAYAKRALANPLPPVTLEGLGKPKDRIPSIGERLILEGIATRSYGLCKETLEQMKSIVYLTPGWLELEKKIQELIAEVEG